MNYTIHGPLISYVSGQGWVSAAGTMYIKMAHSRLSVPFRVNDCGKIIYGFLMILPLIFVIDKTKKIIEKC